MKIKLPMRASLLLGLATAAAAGLVAFVGGAGSAAAATAGTVPSTSSQNWAGYVASGQTFSSVSGSWTVPSVSASSTSAQGYSAVWVGLGGSSDASSSLEQIGTGADYVDGQADYYAWYELLPAAQVRLNMPIHPGDRMSARVSVSGSAVTLSLADTTSSQSVNRTLQMSSPDTSSAEWIVEAPAAQSFGGDQVLPLADFSKVTISDATATAAGHTGGVSDPDWQATRVQLNSQNGNAPEDGPGSVTAASAADATSGAGATTSALSADSFSVSWQANGSGQSVSSSQPGADQYADPGYPYSYGQGYPYGGGGDPYDGDGYSYGGYGYGYG